MKSLDPNITNYFSTKTIKLTFQQWEYKGTAYVEIEGNTTLADILLLKQRDSKFNFEFKDLGKDDYGKSWYRAVLKNDQGEECECEDLIESLSEMLVAVELVNIERES